MARPPLQCRVPLARRLLGAGVLLALISGCGDSPTSPADPTPNPDPDGDGFLSTSDACPNQPETINGVFDDDGCPDTPAEFYGVVRADVEAYWTGVFDQQGWPYSPISLFQGYTDPIDTPCGTIPVNNAVYCGLNAGVYYHEPFIQELLDSIGDAAPAFVIAHEIGHHIGTGHLGWFAGTTLTTKQSELGADCFGGAWLASVEARGMLDEGDADELVETMLTIGDPAETWFDPDQHGTTEQRTAALAIGATNGPWACPPDPGSIGGWIFNDANANGAWDSGEGIWQNVPVTITNQWGEQSTVFTDTNGRWAATDLPIGRAIADIDESAFPDDVVRTFGTDPDTVFVVTGTLREAGYDGFQQSVPSLTLEAGPVARPADGPPR